MQSEFIRVFFTGVIVLIGLPGATQGGVIQRPVTEAARTSRNPAVATVNDFAVALCQQMAKETPDRNVFFSPYSLACALAMAAEGARGNTADEMGKVLRFPAEARRAGGDAANTPWNTALIHQGMAELRKRFGNAKKPVPKEVSDRITTLSAALDAKNRRAATAKNYYVAEFFQAQAQQTAQELNALYRTLDNHELRIANGLWAEKTFSLKKPFLDALNACYGIGAVASMDFAGQPDASRQKLNAWCAEQTQGRIKEPLPPGAITDQTRLVLASGIYFRGEWLNHFVAELTKDDDFLYGGSKIRTPMMHHDEPVVVGYAAFEEDGSQFATPREVARGEQDKSKLYPGTKGFVAVELAYRGGQLSMVILLPRSATGLGDLEKKLSADEIRGWLGTLEQRQVTIVLPKFTLTSNYDMTRILKSLGMKESFDNARADFSGISDQRPLFLSQVLHQASLEVNEKGTVAAAVTFGPAPAGLPETVPFIPTFRANHPFLFFIRDRATGTLLFLGRLMNPKDQAVQIGVDR
ncbi:MAG: serpin family protein [Verrucomicrobia bacterium]|nr:serpin family protein [Verrucomicrobiota bacterium]